MTRTTQTETSFWTPARVYASYRILLAASLTGAFFFSQEGSPLGRSDPGLFMWTSVVYLGLTVVSALIMNRLARRFPNWSSLLPVAMDVLLLTLMIHASGGIQSSLSVLLMVTVASANILLPGRGGLLVAALATLAVLFEQFWFSIKVSGQGPLHLTEAGVLGIAFFVTAIIVRQIAQRLAQSEALTATQRVAIGQLEALNRQIVQRMRTGILVFDSDLTVVLANQSAQNLVDPERPLVNRPMPEKLVQLYKESLDHPRQARQTIKFSSSGATLLVRFAELQYERPGLTLAFLEDQRQLAQEAQQLKLASLGRLSATIAHEIRNPLSAINHAAGLLSDSERNPEDDRLLEIIFSHVSRVNGIIDDVLNLSKRPSGTAARLNLSEVVNTVMTQWREQGAIIHVDAATTSIEVRFDRQQLEQVLNNLVSNALRHGGEGVEVRITMTPAQGQSLPCLRIEDNGPGIAEDTQEHLFEPFFTTSHEGTGLGLYLCRELCEANQAWLEHEPDRDGASFVITFAHPERVFH